MLIICICITQRCIECLIFIRHFPPTSPEISSSFAEKDLQLSSTCIAFRAYDHFPGFLFFLPHVFLCFAKQSGAVYLHRYRIHVWDLTHWYVWHDSLICVVWHDDSFMRFCFSIRFVKVYVYRYWIQLICDMTYWCVWHDSFIFHMTHW